MVLDAVTQRNLELLESPRSDRKHTLIGCLDRTLTPMGARLLREWLTRPLKNVAQIHARQGVIATFATRRMCWRIFANNFTRARHGTDSRPAQWSATATHAT